MGEEEWWEKRRVQNRTQREERMEGVAADDWMALLLAAHPVV